MIKNKKGFTMIELMISLLILTTLTTVGISSFDKFFKWQESKSVSKRSFDIISLLDKRIEIWGISSYSLEFNSGANFLIADINYLNSKDKISIETMSKYMTWIIKWESEQSWIWKFQIIWNDMIKDSQYWEWTWWFIGFDVNGYWIMDEIEANAYLDGILLNEIVFYSLDNMINWDKETSSAVEITSLSWATDSDSKVKITNVLWNKTILAGSGSSLVEVDSFDMTLSKWNKDFSLIIKAKDD